MRKRLVSLGASVVLVAAGFVALTHESGALPSEMRLTKTDVDAPAETIFALIEDFQKWGAWSPHEKADPSVRRTYGGAAKGEGAVYEWEGGDAVGAGRARIAEAEAPAKIVVDVDLTRPIAGHLALTFTLAPSDGKTRIEVATNGPSDLVTKVMGMFFGGDLFGLACAAGGSPKALCRIMVKGLDQP